MVFGQPQAGNGGQAAATTYDAVLYQGHPFAQTHPDRLATLATLFGMKPAPVDRCRVLELGCGDGGNLYPMAYTLPDSEFLGIDLAARPIAHGQAMARALGLKNITLRQLDLMEVHGDFGEFDYIIAHGLYSWVPLAVQDKLLAICKAHLAPQGVAYVSYNTFPGHHLQRLVREMMRFHVRQFAEPARQIQHALAFVKFVAEAKPEPGTYQTLLQQILGELLDHDPASLYHDDLADVNLPVYFHQFVEHAGRHGLQFLSEANFSQMQDRMFPPHVCDTLRVLAKDQIVLKEQYLDFLKGRKFRQTLLCHQDVALERDLKPELMAGFYVASAAKSVSATPDICSTAVEEFRGPHESAMSTGHPLAKAAIMELAESWPRPLPFNELHLKVQSRLGPGGRDEAVEAEDPALALGKIILATYAAGLVELHLHMPQFVMDVSERPVASPVARLQAKQETHDTVVTTMRHAMIRVEGSLERHLLMLLDGTRDRAALLNELAGLVKSGAVTMGQDGASVPDREKALQILSQGLEPNLEKLARLALLVA